ncbi:chloramphenicol-sensitive protein RarD [Terribacillus aidingensis]|uniref:Chloramphenicol-sensitive protein RarD n=1 Tax=Terribacillus aidingensis TaxID=586416 RepID=A0A285N9B6_9BACI|nr:EamA family transporter RarD [Terribacillus aidingensis]SNZ04291.1 chloramphenicol-sensitive protein RarD [Terribacillus aidingensis]
MQSQSSKSGVIYAALAYVMWGILPLFWNLLEEIDAGHLLAHRIVWSFVTMIFIVLVLGKIRPFIHQLKDLFLNKRAFWGLFAASLTVSVNWLVFIWAVNAGHVLQSSLGYYINPLISILLAMIFLKEKSTRLQIISFLLAAFGVIYLTVSYGVFPWVSLLLAISFAVYGLLKKVVTIPPMFGLTIETMFVTPFAVLYLLFVPAAEGTSISTGTAVVLFLSGAATAAPLLLFAHGARRLTLTQIGLLQYIAPTLMLLLGVTLFGEAFTHAHLIAFSCIWGALVLYTISGIRLKRLTARQLNAESAK